MKPALALACSVLLMASGSADLSGFDGTWKTESENAKLPDKPEEFLLQGGLHTCISCVPSFSIRADGVPHEVSGNPYFDAATMTVVNATTFQVDHLKSGKVISHGVLKVSPDGQTLRDDFSHRSGNSPVTGYLTALRVGNGPSGSASLSGAWQIQSLSEADVDRTFTLETSENMFRMSRPTGQSFNAPLSGERSAYTGDPGITSVRVEMVSADEIQETDFFNNVIVGVTTLKLLQGRKQLRSVHVDKLHGFRSASIADRQ